MKSLTFQPNQCFGFWNWNTSKFDSQTANLHTVFEGKKLYKKKDTSIKNPERKNSTGSTCGAVRRWKKKKEIIPKPPSTPLVTPHDVSTENCRMWVRKKREGEVEVIFQTTLIFHGSGPENRKICEVNSRSLVVNICQSVNQFEWDWSDIFMCYAIYESGISALLVISIRKIIHFMKLIKKKPLAR